MTVQLTRRALTLFEDALETPESGRDAWLKAACAGDDELLTQVRRLLDADATAERAMPTGGLQPKEEPAPDHIGHYRIVERIGQGGMGDVFVGQRDDGLFDHAVAIKRVRPSLFAETARALFDRERRALAALSHRYIAQLYDGGVDDTGAPYFIMELVRGVSIDNHVRAHDLSPQAVGWMMIAVCEAVQHAHQNLIVHADLKPANILVNAVGDPKVVDFGVARLLSEGGEGGVYPQTPGYASPQRAAGAAPTAADDVFSLGAVLRALLTGEEPSSATPTLLASQAIARSETFSEKPPAWREARAKAVRGDLDAIIARACAPEAENRYPAAHALAADIRAWLDVRPIAARTGDRFYVARRFIRRRRWRVIAGAAFALALIVGLVTTTVLYAQADFQRRQAEARFTEVRSLAKYLLYDVYERLERTPKTLSTRRDVARVAQGYLNALAETPTAPADVLHEAAEGLVRVADLQAGRSRANLGEVTPALENLDKAEAIAARLSKLDKDAAGVAALRAGIAIRHAAIAMNSNQDFAAASQLLEQASRDIALMPASGRPRAILTLQHEVESAVLGNWKGAYADGAVHAQRAIDAAAALTTNPVDARDLHYLTARAWDALAEAIYYRDSVAASEAPYRKLVDLTAAYTAAHPDDMAGVRVAIEAHWAFGVTLLGINRTHDGLAELDAATALLPDLLNFQPDDEGARRTERIVLAARAQALAMDGRFEEGVAFLRQQLDNVERQANLPNAPPSDRRSHAVTLAMLADLYADNHRPKDACPLYAKANAIIVALDKQGVLSQLDRENSQRMIREHQERLCR